MSEQALGGEATGDVARRLAENSLTNRKGSRVATINPDSGSARKRACLPRGGHTMRVALLTEGTYPMTQGGVSTWCDHLVRGLPDITFDVVALAPSGMEPVTWRLPLNVSDVQIYGVWPDELPRPRIRAARSLRPLIDSLGERMWRAIFDQDRTRSLDNFALVLRELVQFADQYDLIGSLVDRGTSHSLLKVWRSLEKQLRLPPMSVSDAVEAAAAVDHTLALLTISLPSADILHPTANGPCALVAMANQWRKGTPIMMTEHGIYLREQYIALRSGGLSWQVRRAITAFTRRVSELALRESTLVASVSHFNARWAKRLGADPDRLYRIPNGVSPETYPFLIREPLVPTISFVGRIDPLKDLETLLRAHAEVRQRIPGTRLRIFGPTPKENRKYAQELRDLADELGTTDDVVWEGPATTSVPAIQAGHIVALSSISEGLPYTLLESLMCGRPTVSTDVGGTAECVDDQQNVGRIVPARDHRAMADAICELLADPALRAEMGLAARHWTLENYSLGGFVSMYRAAYELTAEAAPASAPELIEGVAYSWHEAEVVEAASV